MKRFLLIMGLIMLSLSYLSLTGCATNRNPTINNRLTEERWMNFVETSPNRWAAGADSWFLAGDANAAEEANRGAPYAQAISTMMVRVPNFSNIKVAGDFQVQIFGTYGPDSVYVNGPNGDVRDIAVSVRGDTLCITQVKGSHSMRQVIVRIGIRNLNTLTDLGGCATIEGVRLNSSAMTIITAPRATGNMYLSGCMNLKRVVHDGTGRINVFGAESSELDIVTHGRGQVNLAGNIALRSIMHLGSTSINLIGVNARCGVKIYADGWGKIGINGHLNLVDVKVRGHVCLYAYGVNSTYLYVYACNNARIGLAGYTHELYVDTSDNSNFAGRYLCAMNAYVKAHDSSHINVSAASKIFASSTQNSSVYFYGSPALMSQFVSGNGLVIPIWMRGPSNCVIPQPAPRPEPVDYKGERVTVHHKRMMRVN